MTLSRSNTPLGEKRELNESVQELDCLLEDLKNVQVTEERSHTRHQQSNFYNSSSSLNAPGGSRPSGSRPHSASSPGSKRPLAAQGQRQADHHQDLHTSRLDREESLLGRNCELIKDVVEEEILVDHVLVPKQQHSDKKFITKQSDRRPGERAKRQVAFGGAESRRLCYDDHDNHHHLHDPESYDNDVEEDAARHQDAQQISSSYVTRMRNNDQQQAPGGGGSMLSINSAATDQSEMTEGSSILDPSKIINCYVCGERVVGQVITALGRNYHREHFTCAHCHQELGTRNFYERDSLPYCELDYQQLFSPKCATCNEPILDKVTIALEQTFHPEHFVCAHCGCQFDVDDGFHEKDGKPYCKDDFFDLFANKCASCNMAITANYITALGVQWHPDCFVCSECHCPFGDGKFFDIEGLPYCEIHYHARRGSLCAVCREPIIGKCTTAMFRKFHPDHFTCTYCLKVLSKSFKEENDKPYCFDCFDKLYS